MKTYWTVIEKDGRQLEIELEGYLYGGEFRCNNVVVTDWGGEEPTEQLHDWVVNNLISGDQLFHIFNEKVVGEGNGDVLDVSLL